MPQRKRPITHRPKVEDESTGNPTDRRGPHKDVDEALPGRGGTKGGLNKYSGTGRRGSAGERRRRRPRLKGGTQQNRGKPKG